MMYNNPVKDNPLYSNLSLMGVFHQIEGEQVAANIRTVGVESAPTRGLQA